MGLVCTSSEVKRYGHKIAFLLFLLVFSAYILHRVAGNKQGNNRWIVPVQLTVFDKCDKVFQPPTFHNMVFLF